MIEQHNTIRSQALGSYSALLHAMLEDPALLVYLDNDDNRKGRPNENLAREVMELFSLGEGNYGEVDIREAARSLTGAGVAPAPAGADGASAGGRCSGACSARSSSSVAGRMVP